MKLYLAGALALSSAVVPMSVAYNVGGGGYERFVSSPRGRFTRCAPNRMRNNGCVDRAFEDLAAELNEDKFRQRRQQRRGVVSPPSNMMMNPWAQCLDEETLRQQQAWLNRAFGLAEDVAKGVASTPREKKEADEVIRQSKEFADRMFGFARGESPYKNDYRSSSTPSEILQDDEAMFQVSLDVPGVKEADLDVTVEGTEKKTLIINGKRNMGKDKNGVMQTKDFSKTFPLAYNSDVERMSASLENGVLVVSVPRMAAVAAEATRKIPLTQISDTGTPATDEAEDDDKPFQLDLDVPGVKESNIDIEVKGDTDKTLTIKAIRELGGKDAEGNPRTTELSKSFQISELVDTTRIVASLKDGVLTVSAPVDKKKAEASVKKVTVNKPPVAESTSDKPIAEDALGTPSTDDQEEQEE